MFSKYLLPIVLSYLAALLLGAEPMIAAITSTCDEPTIYSFERNVRAINYIKSLIEPRTHLLNRASGSYETDPETMAYGITLFSVLYRQSQRDEDSTTARELVRAIGPLQNSDGSWYDSYWTYLPLALTGSKQTVKNAHLNLALTIFHRVFLCSGSDSSEDSLAADALLRAKRNADWLLTMQSLDGSHNCFGALKAGGLEEDSGSFLIAVNTITVCALYGLGDYEYRLAAQRNLIWLVSEPWVFYNKGYFARGQDSNGVFLTGIDVASQTLPLLAFDAVREMYPYRPEWYYAGIDTLIARFQNTVFDSTMSTDTLRGFSVLTETDDSSVWSIGSIYVSIASGIAGRATEHAYFLSEADKMQDATGGVVHIVGNQLMAYPYNDRSFSATATILGIFARSGTNVLNPLNIGSMTSVENDEAAGKQFGTSLIVSVGNHPNPFNATEVLSRVV